jgi:hypothetical protein
MQQKKFNKSIKLINWTQGKIYFGKNYEM